MKALPSIVFNEFKGSAGDVTARVSKGRQVLSARSMHSSSKTPAQAVSRNRLAKISRSYKKLNDEQMKALPTYSPLVYALCIAKSRRGRSKK